VPFATASRLRTVIGKAILALIALSAAWAACVAISGGIEFRLLGWRLTSTDPDRAIYASVILATIYLCFYREDGRRLAEGSGVLLARVALPLVVVLSAGMFLVGIRQGVLVAGGADSWGYVSQADLWLARDLVVEQPIVRQMPWPRADLTFAPLGYVPAPRQPEAIVPMYAPGLPLLMAAGKAALGACGPFVIVPLLAALTVWLTYRLGARLASTLVGLAGAALIATSPTFVFMSMNAMSDVPVTACFTLATVVALSSTRLRALWAGIAVSMAVLIRPNLVPMGAVFLAFVMCRAQPTNGESIWRARWRAFALFSLGGAPLVLATAAANTVLYGGPLSSGYGNLAHYYSWQFGWRNLANYSRWTWQTETPFVLLGAVPLLLGVRDKQGRAARMFIVAFVVGIWLSYLFYTPFDAWWFLRFLLPAFPVIVVAAAWGFALVVGRLRDPLARSVISLVVVTLVLSFRYGFVRSELLGHWREGVPFTSVGAYIHRALPANAIIITNLHSGSARYYGQRMTMRWDFLAPEWWPRAANVLFERGYRPYVLLTGDEEERFRERFGLSSRAGELGTLVATFNWAPSSRLYDPLRSTRSVPQSIPTVVAHPCGCW